MRPHNNIAETRPFSGHVHDISNNSQLLMGQLSSVRQAPSVSHTLAPDMNELLKHGDWDELRSFLDLAVDPFFDFVK